jgi:hypothetical protein
MPHPVEFLFTLNDSERKIFWAMISAINIFITNNKASNSYLVEWLKDRRNIELNLQEYDSKLINYVVNKVIEVIEDDDSVRFLIRGLSNVNYFQYRFIIATMLGWFGSRAKEALPNLVQHASGSGPEVEAAKSAILLIGDASTEIATALRTSISYGDDGELRELCDLACRTSFYTTSDFFDILHVAAKSENPHIREAVADCIRQLDISVKQKFGTILDQLKADLNDDVREAAITASQ